MENLYYTPPTDEIFNEVKKQALLLWGSYDDTYGYASGKQSRIKDLDNIGDNVMYIIAMFDSNNQRLLANVLSDEARQAIRDRLIAGGTDPEIIGF